jgi:hypothetical protein
VQATTAPSDAAVATGRVIERLAEAWRQGVALAVFLETFIGGYPKGLDFGICVGRRTIEGREDFRRYHAGSIAVPGEETGIGPGAPVFAIAFDNSVRTPGAAFARPAFNAALSP